jgi:hypothetical protein
MDARDEILNRIEERQDEWLRLLGDLVRRPSENPPGDTFVNRSPAGCAHSKGPTTPAAQPPPPTQPARLHERRS